MKIRSWDIGNTKSESYIQINFLEFEDHELLWFEAIVSGVGFEGKARFATDCIPWHADGTLDLRSGENWLKLICDLRDNIRDKKNKATFTNNECHGDEFNIVFEKDRDGIKVTLNFVGEESWTNLTHVAPLEMEAVRKATLSLLDALRSWGIHDLVFSSLKDLTDFRNSLKVSGKTKGR